MKKPKAQQAMPKIIKTPGVRLTLYQQLIQKRAVQIMAIEDSILDAIECSEIEELCKVSTDNPAEGTNPIIRRLKQNQLYIINLRVALKLQGEIEELGGSHFNESEIELINDTIKILSKKFANSKLQEFNKSILTALECSDLTIICRSFVNIGAKKGITHREALGQRHQLIEKYFNQLKLEIELNDEIVKHQGVYLSTEQLETINEALANLNTHIANIGIKTKELVIQGLLNSEVTP